METKLTRRIMLAAVTVGVLAGVGLPSVASCGDKTSVQTFSTSTPVTVEPQVLMVQPSTEPMVVQSGSVCAPAAVVETTTSSPVLIEQTIERPTVIQRMVERPVLIETTNPVVVEPAAEPFVVKEATPEISSPVIIERTLTAPAVVDTCATPCAVPAATCAPAVVETRLEAPALIDSCQTAPVLLERRLEQPSVIVNPGLDVDEIEIEFDD